MEDLLAPGVADARGDLLANVTTRDGGTQVRQQRMAVQVSSGRRPLVLMGNGAFQMTGPETANAPAYRCNPVVVLLNNNSSEMLQAFFPPAKYNETAPWPFAKLVELWGGRGFEARTARELRDALRAAWREARPTLIEVTLARGDISPVLRGFVEALRERVQPKR